MHAAKATGRQIRDLERSPGRFQPKGHLMSRTGPVWAIARASITLVVLLLTASTGLAELRLDITRGKVEPMPIAIPAFAGGSADETQTGRDMAQVVAADLERSGLFRPLDARSFIQNVAAGERPRFGDWRQINAQALVTRSVPAQGGGR